MAKVKRYNGQTGDQMTDSDVSSFAGTPENESNAGMAPEAGMMEKEPEENFKPTPKAKAPIVTKEELAKSGLTLREYMNQKQGLKPRGEKAAASTAVKGDDQYNPAVKQRLKDDQYNPAVKQRGTASKNILEEAKEGVRRSNAAREAISTASRQMKAGDMPKYGPGLSALSGQTKMKKGGEVKGWGMARGARKAKIY